MAKKARRWRKLVMAETWQTGPFRCVARQAQAGYSIILREKAIGVKRRHAKRGIKVICAPSFQHRGQPRNRGHGNKNGDLHLKSLVYDRPGDPAEVLQLRESPLPEP